MLTFDSGRNWTFCQLHSIGGGIISLSHGGKTEKHVIASLWFGIMIQILSFCQWYSTMVKKPECHRYDTTT